LPTQRDNSTIISVVDTLTGVREMRTLIEGVQKFQKTVVGPRREFFERLAQGQSPQTLFITCSDSRIDPNLLTQTEPGELFVLRNAGNLVPPYDRAVGGEAATIEYAVRALKVRQIIVCGHSHCGAMQGLLHPESLDGLPAVRDWLEHAEETRVALTTRSDSVTSPPDRLAAAVEQNVLVQLNHLTSHPSVRERLDQGDLELVGWVYRIETGEVFAYDDSENQFVPLVH